MLRIGLTMRVETASTGEIRDAIDSAWPAFIEKIGFEPALLPHRINPETIEIDALILTGGNDVLQGGISYYEARNTFEFKLLEQAKNKGLKTVGICRGMQIINLFCGGTVTAVQNHVAKSHSINFADKTITVNSYHNDGISESDLGENLNILARAEDHSIEAFQHEEHPWLGIMWHPEREIENPDFHMNYLKEFFESPVS